MNYPTRPAPLKHDKLYVLALCLVVVITYHLPTLWAQESRVVTTRELTRLAREIVVAEVLSHYTAWDTERREIYTYTELRVEERLKSSRPDSIIQLRHPGGQVGAVTSHVTGVPTFAEGERVLVFLGPYSGSRYYGVIDWRRGKYTIRRNRLMKTGLHGQGPVHGTALSEFLAEVRSYL